MQTIHFQRDLLTVEYTPQFFAAKEANKWFSYLQKKIPWQQQQIWMMGKKIWQPRLICWFGDVEYSYSRTTWPSCKWPSEVLKLKRQVEKKCQQKFNSCLLNYYRTGQDSMGYHADDEPQLRQNPYIASVSFGGERNFILKHKTDKSIERLKIGLEHGSLLAMKEETQHHWVHGIPKTKKQVKPRINLTFRWTYPK